MKMTTPMKKDLFPLELQDACVAGSQSMRIGPIDLVIPGHGFWVIIGPNGAGKTTLLRLIGGLETLSQGTICTRAHGETRRLRPALPFVFQHPVMMNRTVADCIAYPLTLLRVKRQCALARVSRMAHKAGLGQLLHHKASTLSAGERQKLALARALINEPDLLLLDEPCANLDGASTKAIEAMLGDSYAKGCAIIMATHDAAQASRLASHILFMHQGRIHEHGKADHLLNNPKNKTTRLFLAGEILA
ncbi:MAG: ATP-binding cassette domain-containing protein [Pseudomonadota bacterium]